MSTTRGEQSLGGAHLSDEEWYNCNDEVVTKKGDPPKKRLKLSSDSSDGKGETSRDAYMLVYKQDLDVQPIEPPKEILDIVEAENASFRADLDEKGDK